MNQEQTAELDCRLIQPEADLDDDEMHEHLLGEKINESINSSRELIREDSGDITDKINKIKPVQKLILFNDNVRRMYTDNDG